MAGRDKPDLYHLYQCSIKEMYELKPKVFENDDEHIKYILDIICESDEAWKICIPKSSKSEEYSLKLRLDASNEKNLDRVFIAITESIAYAPPGSAELALSFDFRSKITLGAKLIDECLKDIENALMTHGCPINLKPKLYLRQAKCYQITKQEQSLIESTFLNARKYVKYMDEHLRHEMNVLIDEQENQTTFNPMVYNISHYEDQSMVKLKKENPDIPGASDAITIKYDENYGRHIVATRDIEPGETLLVQKPYVPVLLSSKKYNFCWYCCKQTWSSIPCEKCTRVIFCSRCCADKAMREFHDYECPIIETFFINKFSYSCLFEFRLLIKAFKESNSSLHKLKTIFDRIEAEPESLSTDGKFIFSNYTSILSLPVNNNMSMTRKNFLIGNNILTAYYLACETNLIGINNEDNTLNKLKDEENFVFLTKLLYRLTKISELNSVQPLGILNDETNQPVFQSMDPVFHFFNHSCMTSITRIWHGDYVVAKSLIPIKKDEQIYDNYNTPYYLMNCDERRKQLNKIYDFVCNCEVCEEDWPVKCFDYLPPFGDFKKYDDMSLLLKSTREEADFLVETTKENTLFQYNQGLEIEYNVAVIVNVARKFLKLDNNIENAIELVKFFFEKQPKDSLKVHQAVSCLEKLLKIKQNKIIFLSHSQLGTLV